MRRLSWILAVVAMLVAGPNATSFADEGFASLHVLLLTGSEEPHVHAKRDLVVLIISGLGRMHIDGVTHVMQAGDVFSIPAGVEHWAENEAPGGSEAYAMFLRTK